MSRVVQQYSRSSSLWSGFHRHAAKSCLFECDFPTVFQSILSIGNIGTRGFTTSASRCRYLRKHMATIKRRVRPNWSLLDWERNQLCKKSWPTPHAGSSLTSRTQEHKDSNLDSLEKPSWGLLPWLIHQDLATVWPDAGAFALDRLLESYNERHEFCVGTVDETHEEITVQLSDYLEYYEHHTSDDAPLYIFDDNILCSTSLSDAYVDPVSATTDPSVCDRKHNDLMAYMEDRPPYAWLLVGAPRSGTALHVDPLATSAWNTIVSGRKRWILLPPLTSIENCVSADQKDECVEGSESSACQWLIEEYPHLRRNDRILAWDFIQAPGDTVYVPRGWRHCAINLEWTVAVTHNFVANEDASVALAAVQDDSEFSSEEVEAWKHELLQHGCVLSQR